MADDLRAKIAKTFACRCDPVWTERKLHAPDCVEELGEDVLDEVADWLRDEAAEQARLSKREDHLMPRHAAPLPYLRRPVPVPRWALALGAVFGVLLVATTAVAAVTPTYNAQCVVTPKSNGGQVLDCDPIAAPSTSPSATSSPSGSPTASPSPTQTTAPPSTTTPPPSTTAPPSSPPAALWDCLHNLAACGFPNDLNTGPVGPLTISTRTQYSSADETVSGVDIRGCVEVRATNVTFRNVRIAAPCFWAVRSFAAGAVFEDVEITCNNTPGSNGYSNGSGGTVTLRRADIHDCENGLNVPGNTTVVDSWIHNLYDGGDAHTDGAQFNQGAANIVFSHNTIDARGNTTSAIIMWDEGDPQNRNVTIASNLLAGGSYTLYCGRSGTAVNVVIANNRFGPFTYGYANSCDTGGEVWSGNVRDLDGATLGAA